MSTASLIAMNYCSECGNTVNLRIPKGDSLPRYICDHCHTVHYQNPKIVAGCLPEWDNRILLCRRAIEPRYGLWTLPAGFMENGETTEQAALRETWEEAETRVDITSLYSVISLPHISQVYLIFRASLQQPVFSAGSESLDVQLFRENEIPWDELAFPVMKMTLERYCQDLVTGEFPLYVDHLSRPIRPKT